MYPTATLIAASATFVSNGKLKKNCKKEKWVNNSKSKWSTINSLLQHSPVRTYSLCAMRCMHHLCCSPSSSNVAAAARKIRKSIFTAMLAFICMRVRLLVCALFYVPLKFVYLYLSMYYIEYKYKYIYILTCDKTVSFTYICICFHFLYNSPLIVWPPLH